MIIMILYYLLEAEILAWESIQANTLNLFRQQGVLDEFWFISANKQVYQLHYWLFRIRGCAAHIAHVANTAYSP
jgi:hypothetical protein